MSQPLRTYKTIIADDNDLDRLALQVQLKKYPFLELTGIYHSAEEAISRWSAETEVMLLDIDMPGNSGLELRRTVGNNAACIFITAYPDYAIESFEVAALDFLVKPIDRDRFALAMSRLHDYLEIKHKAGLFECSLGTDTVFIKDGHDQVKIPLHEIVYLEALKDYTRIVTQHRKYCVLSVLGNLLKESAFSTFVRVHRSYAVQKHFIERVTPQKVILGDIEIPIGRSYKPALDGIIPHP